MPHKQVTFRAAAREKVLNGATALADAVRVTLGPKSKCVLIERKWGHPLVCNDGVTIAREFDLPDHDENLGAQVLRQAAERTGDAVGDGTTFRCCCEEIYLTRIQISLTARPVLQRHHGA